MNKEEIFEEINEEIEGINKTRGCGCCGDGYVCDKCEAYNQGYKDALVSDAEEVKE